MTTKKFGFSMTIIAAMALIIFCAIESTFSSPAENIDRINVRNKETEMERKEGIKLLKEAWLKYADIQRKPWRDEIEIPPEKWELYYDIITSLRDGTPVNDPNLLSRIEVLYDTFSGKISTPYVFYSDVQKLNANESLIQAYLTLCFMEMTLEPLRGVTIKVYQVLDGKSLDNPDDHKFLGSEELPGVGVNIEKVTDAVLDWMSGTPNLGLLVTASDKDEQNVNVEISPPRNNDWTQPSLELWIHNKFLNASNI